MRREYGIIKEGKPLIILLVILLITSGMFYIYTSAGSSETRLNVDDVYFMFVDQNETHMEMKMIFFLKYYLYLTNMHHLKVNI